MVKKSNQESSLNKAIDTAIDWKTEQYRNSGQKNFRYLTKIRDVIKTNCFLDGLNLVEQYSDDPGTRKKEITPVAIAKIVEVLTLPQNLSMLKSMVNESHIMGLICHTIATSKGEQAELPQSTGFISRQRARQPSSGIYKSHNQK